MLDDLSIAGAFGPKRECTKRIRAFEAAWARLQSEAPGWPTDAVDRAFHDALIDWLRFHEAMLIGELVPETLKYLRSNPGCEELKAFDHVIVDEYQDLNRAEQDLIELLASNGSIAIVGDVDQSIYHFRHANPEGIENYNVRNANTHDEVLSECRRCPTSVVSIADHLIKNNHPGQNAPRLQPLAGNAAGEIHIVQWDSVEEEAKGLASFIDDKIKKGAQPGEVLVLTPRRLLGYAVRDELEARNVPVHSFYHEEALEDSEAQVAYCKLCLLVEPNDRTALRWWLGDKSPSRRRNAYKLLRDTCEASGKSPKETLDDCVAGKIVVKGINDLLARYTLLTAEMKRLQTLTVTQLIDELFPSNVEGCGVLREVALAEAGSIRDARELLDCIRSSITQPVMPEKVDYVRVMSLHKSKGLTSKIAIVSGCSHGLIPFLDSDHTPIEARENLREQRRLFYVAITRCTETLVISSVASMKRNFAWKIGARVAGFGITSARTIASQFMSELGPTAPQSKRGMDWQKNDYSPRCNRRARVSQSLPKLLNAPDFRQCAMALNNNRKMI